MSNIELMKGDITKLEIEAIVNAANSSLMGGGGVDGAIHKAGGPRIHEECERLVHKMGGCPPGEAVITSAGDMPSKYVIHTVGPIWKNGKINEEAILANCYRNTLELAHDFGIRSVAFPNISTGAYRFPKELAATIALRTVIENFDKCNMQKVIFISFDDENYEIYQSIMKDIDL
jgi:O-acetyl-ADP-ribose deacetylase